MIVAADIKNMDDVLLVHAGCEISERYINIFQTWGISEIFVEATDDGSSDAPAEESITVTPELLDEMKAHFWHLDDTNPVHQEILNLMARRRARHRTAC